MRLVNGSGESDGVGLVKFVPESVVGWKGLVVGTVVGRPVALLVGGWMGVAGSSVSDRAFWLVTWLILPVVICLSQRLSHACLSTGCCE